MTTHIYSGPLSMFGAKVEIAAREKGIAFELVMVPFIEGDAYEPKHPEVLRVNPVKQQVPVLVDDIDGHDNIVARVQAEGARQFRDDGHRRVSSRKGL
eukprot:gene53368-71338_t